MATKRQIAIAEHFIKKETKRMMKEEEAQKRFIVYKRQVNPAGLVEIESYNVQSIADKVCKVLNQAAANMTGQRNKSGQDYIVRAE